MLLSSAIEQFNILSKIKYKYMNIIRNTNHKKNGKNKKCKAPQYKPNVADNMRLHFTDNEMA